MEGVNFGWLMNAIAELDATNPVSDEIDPKAAAQVRRDRLQRGP